MKRVLAILAIMLLPLSVWAMTPITDSQLSNVTGQAGVSINADFTMNIQFAQMGWGDPDGVAALDIGGGGGISLGYEDTNGVFHRTPMMTAAVGGWVGLDSFKIKNLHIWPRTDFSADNTKGIGNGGWEDLQFLTIDVVSLPSAELGGGQKGSSPFGTSPVSLTTAVRIGLGTWTISMDYMSGNVVLGPQGTDSVIGGVVDGAPYAARTINTPQFDQLLGKFYIGDFNMATGRDGAVLIFAHGFKSTVGELTGHTLYGSGVTMFLDNVNVDYMLMAVAAWGDIDGLLVYSHINSTIATVGLDNEGWVGLTNFALSKLVIDGAIAIDVGTTSAANDTALVLRTGGAVDWPSLINAFAHAYNVNIGSTGKTFVNIAFPNAMGPGQTTQYTPFTITMAEMGATVSLGTSPNVTLTPLTPNAGVSANMNQNLGDIYVSDMKVQILDNPLTGTPSFISIFSH